MRKVLLAVAIAMLLAGCMNQIKTTPEAEKLKELRKPDPKCTFLYKIETSVAAYDPSDGRRYLANEIARQAEGNAHMIVSSETRKEERSLFRPDASYAFTANVYRCPE